ncbi:MAG TPA: hypothetical protein VI727_02825 [Candidatus Brocadiaceae bacterium]|nr:hypothetical protein [Candidatus Brocadiaceae bacterium]
MTLKEFNARITSCIKLFAKVKENVFSKFLQDAVRGISFRLLMSYFFSWQNNDEVEGKYDGSYLLRTNRRDLTEQEIWQLYVMLTSVERAFRNLKSDLGLRPIYHQKERRVDAHIFISVLAYHVLHDAIKRKRVTFKKAHDG